MVNLCCYASSQFVMNFTYISLLTLNVLNSFIDLIIYIEVCIYIICFMCFSFISCLDFLFPGIFITPIHLVIHQVSPVLQLAIASRYHF